MYYNNNVRFNRRHDLEIVDIESSEIMVCEMLTNSNERIIIVVAYRPPSSNDMFNNNIKKVLASLRKLHFRNILLIGDLNMPGVQWDTNSSNRIYVMCF